MIAPPKGYLLSGHVVKLAIDHLDAEAKSKDSKADIDVDESSIDFSYNDLLEIELMRACTTGLYAWRGDGNPILIVEQMPFTGMFPNTLFFNVTTDTIGATRYKRDGTPLSVLIAKDGQPNTIIESTCDRIDLYKGYWALFQEEAVMELFGTNGVVKTGGQDDQGSHSRSTAAVTRAKIFAALSDEDLIGMGPKTARKHLEKFNEHWSESTAIRAVRAERKKRGLA